jgi:hypothetical protein
MKNTLIFILFLLGFILIGTGGHNFFSDLGIDFPSFSYAEEEELQKEIGGLFCIISILLFIKARSVKRKKEQEKEQERLRVENEKYNLWYNSLSEDEKIEVDYKKWVENTPPLRQETEYLNLIIQESDNFLFEYATEEEKGNYKYRKLTPLEDRIVNGSKEEKEKKKAEAAFRLEENRAAANKRKADLSRRFKNDEVDKILKNTLWLGMTEEMLLEVKGQPNDTAESVSVGKVKKKYFYGKRKNRLGNNSFDFEVNLENDIVTGWKDIVN